jgi:hypothetical protein
MLTAFVDPASGGRAQVIDFKRISGKLTRLRWCWKRATTDARASDVLARAGAPGVLRATRRRIICENLIAFASGADKADLRVLSR